MQRTVVLLTVLLVFLAPLAIATAQAADFGAVRADSSCRKSRKHSDSKPKKKDKDKDGKKPYGFEL